jgi:hypothetical protein
MDMHIKSFNTGVIEPLLQRLGDPNSKFKPLPAPNRIHSYLVMVLAISFNRHEGLFRNNPDSHGVFHITPSQHLTLWDNHLAKDPELSSFIRGLASQHQFLQTPHHELSFNLNYTTAIAAYAISLSPLVENGNVSLHQKIALLNKTFPGFKGITKREWLQAEKRLYPQIGVNKLSRHPSDDIKPSQSRQWIIYA